MHVAFSDIHIAVKDLVAEEDKVVSRFTVRGRYTGDFMGVAPTGREVTVVQISIDSIAVGRLWNIKGSLTKWH